MIARHWKGIVKHDHADRYLTHLEHHTIATVSSIDGFRRVTVLRREVEVGVEFLVVTEWESIQAIKKFAGESAEVAVVPPAAQAMMVSYDTEVIHYEIVEDMDKR